MLKISIVDDERSVRESFAMFLEEQGHVVKTFENPLGILEDCATCFIQEDPYCNVLLIDYNMPSMTGLEFLEKTKKICRLSSNRKFLVSGALNCQIISKAKELGAEHVHKPLSLNALNLLISLANKQVHPSLDESSINVERKSTYSANGSQTKAQDKIQPPIEIPFKKTNHPIVSTYIPEDDVEKNNCQLVKLCGGVFRGELLRLELPGLCLDYGVYNIGKSASEKDTENCYIVGLVLDCESETTFFQQELSNNDLVYLPPYSEQDFIVGGQAVWCTLTFNKEQFETAYKQHVGESTTVRPIEQSVVVKNTATIKLIRLVRSLFLSEHQSIQESRSLCVNSSLTQNLLKTSLSAIFSNQDISTDQKAKNHAQIVAKAEDYLNGLWLEPVKIKDLARALNVSVRSLQYAFQNTLAITPSRYMKIRRLNFARQGILRDPDKPISYHASQAGFWHMAHFSSDYKELFGETPKETIRKHKKELKADI